MANRNNEKNLPTEKLQAIQKLLEADALLIAVGYKSKEDGKKFDIQFAKKGFIGSDMLAIAKSIKERGEESITKTDTLLNDIIESLEKPVKGEAVASPFSPLLTSEDPLVDALHEGSEYDKLSNKIEKLIGTNKFLISIVRPEDGAQMSVETIVHGLNPKTVRNIGTALINGSKKHAALDKKKGEPCLCGGCEDADDEEDDDEDEDCACGQAH